MIAIVNLIGKSGFVLARMIRLPEGAKGSEREQGKKYGYLHSQMGGNNFLRVFRGIVASCY